MPEIKIKHVVSFSTEDKVHKAENLLKEETYRKWKCAAPGEKNATIVLQFEKATEIHSIDIGNEGSAFVEVLVGRSSDSVSDYQVLLVASSFMSPIESRNGTHANRVRMFGPDKLSQNTKDEKWDCVQIVCTQPFNKNLQYGLTFIKFHSPPEKIEEQNNRQKPVTKLGAFSLKDDAEEDEDSLPSLSSWFGKQKTKSSESSPGSSSNQASPSYAAAVLASANSTSKVLSQDSSLKRKGGERSDVSEEPPTKKTVLNKEHIVYKDVLRGSPESTKASDTRKNATRDAPSPKVKEKKKEPPSAATSSPQHANNSPRVPPRQNVQFNKIMDKVVFVLSGFVNPLRSDLRDKALKMGAKYKPDWDATCTHLVCAFAKTPKYDQVKKLNGRIVTKEWIVDSYQKKEPLPWNKYKLSSDDSSDESDDSDKNKKINDTKRARNKAVKYKDDDDDEDPFAVDDDSDADPNFKYNAADDDAGDDDDVDDDAEEEENSDELVDEDSDDGNYDDKRKKKKKTKRKLQRKKENNSPNKRNTRGRVTNQTVKNTDASSERSNLSTPTKRAYNNLSDSEKESSTPKKKDTSSIFSRLQNSQQKDDNSQSPTIIKNDESETEDEDAIQDYIAKTDVEENDDSGGDTEDEIRKGEEKVKQSKNKTKQMSEIEEFSEKPDISDLPLPDLPDFFKKKHFYLFGDFSPLKLHQLKRCITAYNGVLEDYMNDEVKYVITEQKWDKHFDDALSENEDLIFVKSTWIYKCHEAGKLVPYQPHIVIPDT